MVLIFCDRVRLKQALLRPTQAGRGIQGLAPTAPPPLLRSMATQ